MNKIKIVADIGINHNGDIEIANKLIDSIKLTGCDFVKFQKRCIELVYTDEDLNKPRESPWGTTNREQKIGIEFRGIEYDAIDGYCRQNSMSWFASPWDCKSVDFLAKYSPPYMKVASACITDFELLEAVRSTKIPVILSTGMSTKKEIDRAVEYLGDHLEYILACTSTYPTKDVEMNINFITTLKKEFPKYRIGFSNHSPGIIYMCVAVALGVEMIEFHITLDRAMYGSDQAASIELPGVWALTKHIRHLEVAMGNGNWVVYPSEELVKEKLRRK